MPLTRIDRVLSAMTNLRPANVVRSHKLKLFPSGGLTMTERTNLEELTRPELRDYVLSHRDNEEALHLYMDRLHTDPDVERQTGAFDEDGAAFLKRLIEEAGQKQNDRMS